MVPELEKPRVTEIQVRMDCNGCVQKVKKALNGITGIYDVQINYPEQKIAILGWADPEKIVKAIRKARKTATICAQAAEDAPTPAPDEGNPPAAPETGSAEAAPPTEPSQNQQPQSQAALAPSSDPPVINLGQALHQLEPEEIQEVRVGYGQPPDRYRDATGPSYGSLNTYQNIRRFPNDPPQQPQIYTTQLPPPSQTTHGPRYITSRQSRQGYETEPPLQVRATHNYNTSRLQWQTFTTQPSPQMSAIQPPSHFQEPQNYRRHRSPPPQLAAFQPERDPQFQETQNYHISRQPPPSQMPVFQPPPQIREPQQYDPYRSSPQSYTNQAPQPYYTSSQPLQVVQSTQNYNTYSPSPYVTNHIQLPSAYTPYSTMDRYNEDYRYTSNNYNSNANIASVFSDENPNSCIIM